MIPLLIRIVGNLGTLVTAASFLFTADLGALVQVLLWVLMVVAVGVIVADIRYYYYIHPRKYAPNSEEIADYLCDWLNDGGRAAVFTRDLTWAHPGSRAASILTRKAKLKELVLFVQATSDFVNALAADGAEIVCHIEGFVPQSRFTVIDYGKSGSRIAIGLVENGKHVIREFDAGTPHVMSLAHDLVELSRRSGARLP